MLTLTKKTEYALIATCHLARLPDQQHASARDLAEEYGIRLPLMMNTLKLLNQAGLLRSLRGANGGYALSREPNDISLAQIIEAMEGAPKLIRCATPPSETAVVCELVDNCPVRSPLAMVHMKFVRFLNGVSLADLAFDESFGAGAGNAKGSERVVNLVKAIAQ